MKGVSSLIVIIMILLISLSLFIMIYTFTMDTDAEFRSNVEEKQNEEMREYGSSLNILYTNATIGTITVINDGKWELTGFSLYINGKKTEITGPSRILPGDSVNFTFVPISAGNYTYTFTSDYAKAMLSGQ